MAGSEGKPVAKAARQRRPLRMYAKEPGPVSSETSTSLGPLYAQLLDLNPEWALSEGSRHFEEKSAVFDALRKIAQRLDSIGVPYAVVGGMALFRHGLRRFTEDVDILVTKADLKTIHEKLEGLGYLPPHKFSKHLRDTELGVRIEFLTTGEYPGDGERKPVAFPDPRAVRFEADGVSYINLEKLIELKLASGMTNAGRLKDLSDVMELIKILNLSAEYASQLDPFVRKKYQELWEESTKVYMTLWRNKWLTAHAKSLDDMVEALREAAATLDAMRKDGVTLDPDGVGDDYAHLVTSNPDIAKKYDMLDETEFWGDGDEDDEDEDDEEHQADRAADEEKGPEATPE